MRLVRAPIKTATNLYRMLTYLPEVRVLPKHQEGRQSIESAIGQPSLRESPAEIFMPATAAGLMRQLGTADRSRTAGRGSL